MIQRILLKAIAKKNKQRLLRSIKQWMDLMRKMKNKKREEQIEALSLQIEQLKAENNRLRRDNERFVRLIDSGDWSRSRVEELRKAGDVLRSERDAVMELIEKLGREHESIKLEKAAQEEEFRRMKSKILSGGSTSPAARNRMLVKGASSYNSLVRALKQDLIDRKAAVRDPTIMVEIDKLAMDKVHVFPDGELKIEAFRKSNGQ